LASWRELLAGNGSYWSRRLRTPPQGNLLPRDPLEHRLVEQQLLDALTIEVASRQSEHRCTAAMAPVSALCQTKETP